MLFIEIIVLLHWWAVSIVLVLLIFILVKIALVRLHVICHVLHWDIKSWIYKFTLRQVNFLIAGGIKTVWTLIVGRTRHVSVLHLPRIWLVVFIVLFVHVGWLIEWIGWAIFVIRICAALLVILILIFLLVINVLIYVFYLGSTEEHFVIIHVMMLLLLDVCVNIIVMQEQRLMQVVPVRWMERIVVVTNHWRVFHVWVGVFLHDVFQPVGVLFLSRFVIASQRCAPCLFKRYWTLEKTTTTNLVFIVLLITSIGSI